MYRLITAIGELSVLLHQFLINIVLNSSVEIFIHKMMRLASLDPLPVDDYLDELFGEQDALSPAFDSLGYESPFLLYNNGSTTIFSMAFPIIIIVYWLHSKARNKFMARYAQRKLDSYTVPTVYALIYATQLTNTFIIAINCDHIIEKHIPNALSEVDLVKNVSNLVTMVMVICFLV